MICLGFDTSNYTTSVAWFDGATGRNRGRLLDVPPGDLGLRQSDALFQHVKRLPELMEAMALAGEMSAPLAAVGASTRPRGVAGSYMPCFLAGEALARSVAAAEGVPFFGVSHQQGHVAAAAWSAGRVDLLDTPHLAWHLSGGTTELLLVEPDGGNLSAKKLGGSTDLSAGQLVDRTGKKLGLAFPGGKALDALAGNCPDCKPWNVRVDALSFSLSGMENKMNQAVDRGLTAEEIAALTLTTVAAAVAAVTRKALEQHPGLPVLCSGGVASSRLLRRTLTDHCAAVFAPPEYSSDNALGVAILTSRLLKGKG